MMGYQIRMQLIGPLDVADRYPFIQQHVLRLGQFLRQDGVQMPGPFRLDDIG